MSILSFLGKVLFLDWLLGYDKEEKIALPTKSPLGYDQEDDYFDKIHSLESHIDELERQQAKYDILSDRYDELQDRIDDLQEELDDMEDFFDDDL